MKMGLPVLGPFSKDEVLGHTDMVQEPQSRSSGTFSEFCFLFRQQSVQLLQSDIIYDAVFVAWFQRVLELLYQGFQFVFIQV